MSTHGEIRQDYAVPPGWLLEERIELKGWSQAELARRCGRSAKNISEIIQGVAPIEPDTALQLEKVLGLSAKIWLNLESNYRLQLARLREEEKFDQASDWYESFPVGELVSEGLFQEPVDKLAGVKSLLSFFGVGSLDAWESKIGNHVALARHSRTFKSTKAAVSVWLRLGEIEAEKQECAEYNLGKFKEALKEIRFLSRSEPEEFHPRMTHLCNEAGLAFVVVPPLKGTKLGGAAWWMSKHATGKTPVIQQSLRGKRNDLFWFTFFHEAAHILLHSKKDTFVDEDKHDGAEIESQADDWARDFLVPQREWDEFVGHGAFTKTSIETFASRQGIAPGIVLGRLQHEEIVGWNSYLNKLLKVSFVWSSERDS